MKMKSESQTIEYKESWHDEYLKWICGFANAQGGILYIGVNDSKQVAGVKNAKKLLEDIPNMVKDKIGIIIDVNLLESGHKEYLQIVVPSSLYPISLRGKYYYRTGSTMQELRGISLDQFLLSHQGRSWDGVPLPGLTSRQLDGESIDVFKKEAVRSQRMTTEDVSCSRQDLLKRLHLYAGKYLKRAAALLFCPDPERFVTGAYVKIGYFLNNFDLKYQDEVHGSLFRQVAVTLDLLTTKYTKAEIRYDGLQRIDELPYPGSALREGVLNSICHKSYGEFSPIQIRVYDDHISIWNPGNLPMGWTVNNLMGKHDSKPFNPDIANTFFRAGYIESWGRGIEKIITACRDYGCPKPEWEFDGTGLRMTLWFKKNTVTYSSDKTATMVQSVSKTCPRYVQDMSKTLQAISENGENGIDIATLMKEVGEKNRRVFARKLIAPALEAGLIERTIPDKPTSRYQRYRITEEGRKFMKSD